MIPFVFALTCFILLALVFVIPGLFLFYRWIDILTSAGFNTGDMKVPTFYASEKGAEAGNIFFMSAVGVVFGGIHCAGWLFYFPSHEEAILWRVSSAVLTGVALLLSLLENSKSPHEWEPHVIAVLTIFLLVYVVARLLLLVEAFISLRQLTPGMLALVKWTSFLPHI